MQSAIAGQILEAQAEAFGAAGGQWLQLVDRNGAFAGTPVNGAAVW